MSWDGTVRCGYCYTKGHNRRGCPEVEKRMKEVLADNPNSKRAKEYYEKKNQAGKRRCSYCSALGHQRRTCKELIYAKEVAVEKCAEWRVDFVEKLKREGVGTGTLVSYDTYYDGRKAGLVVDIRWNSLDHRLGDTPRAKALVVKPLDEFTGRYAKVEVRFPRSFFANPDSDSWVDRATEVIGPISALLVSQQIPAGFLTGKDCIEQIFREDWKPQERTASWQIEEWCPKQGFYDTSPE